MRLITGLLVSLSFVLLGPAQRSEAQQASGPQTALVDLSTQPNIAPAPDWVAPVDFPVDNSNGDEAPYRILLHDQQVSLEPGRRTTYSEVVVRIQTPAGLAAGNLLFPWRPATDVLTVHKVQILRGDRVIDVLESGQTFTVIRREQNLENAILDGVLTAIMQPEGLQVGDILAVASSVTASDPVLGEHVEHLGAAWNVAPIARAHLSVQWPQTMRVRHRLTSGLPAARIVRSGRLSRIDIAIDDLEPIAPPSGAPQRFMFPRLAEFTTFSAWSDIARLMSPLYERASQLPPEGPLLDEVEAIRERSSDPIARAEAALALVQDRVRYVALQMGEGGLVPADAATTWSRRFGDCKGKTALLLAILHALEIEAEPVFVSTIFGDGLDQRAPMVGLFDHVLVRATINGRQYWLDGTRSGDARLPDLQVPNFVWGLPIVPDAAALVRIQPTPLETPNAIASVAIDARAGLYAPAPIHAEYAWRGDAAVAANMAYSSLGRDARDRLMREYWRRKYESVEITDVGFTFDAAGRELRLTMDGVIRMDWSRSRFRVRDVDLGFRADYHREPGPNRDAPFAVAFPVHERMVATIQLPSGQSEFTIRGGEDVDLTAAGIEFRRRASIADQVFHAEASWRSVAPEFPAENAAADQAAIRELGDQLVSVVAPSTYAPTDADLAALAALEPTDAAGFVRRGNLFLDGRQYDESLADFDRAISLEPRNALALANRGITHVWRGEFEAARRDLDAAAAIDPSQIVVFRARGLLAQQEGARAEAIESYSRALAISPDDSFSLGHRAEVLFADGDLERALADSAAALLGNPRWTNLYLLRANIFVMQDDFEGAALVAEALIAAIPDDAYARVVAARIYDAVGRQDDAFREVERALAIAPASYVYLNRALLRPREDVEGRRADFNAALELDPNALDALKSRAEFLRSQGDFEGAVEDLTQALRAHPDDAELLIQRGVAYALAERQALAQADFDAVRARAAGRPALLNNMCWAKATAAVMLESALADCDAALAERPDSAGYLDSRALVLLRLGRVEEALETYDRVLSVSADMPTSLYGRGLARLLSGAEEEARADFTAAAELDAEIAAEFEAYGLSPGSR